MRPSILERFWAKVDQSGGCWQWVGGVGTHGYGNFWVGSSHGHARAHRFAYEVMVGPIPDGLVIDHLCRNRRCVNPSHLEPVTQRINAARGGGLQVAAVRKQEQTHCKSGHPLSGDNLYVQPKTGYRYCRTCQRQRHLDYVARRAAG